MSPSSLIVTRFPLGTCGYDSASWFRIALAPPLFWIVIERFLPLTTLFVTDSCAGVGGAGGHGFAGELCRTLMFGMTVHLPATGEGPNRPVVEVEPERGQVGLLQRHEERVVEVPAVDLAPARPAACCTGVRFIAAYSGFAYTAVPRIRCDEGVVVGRVDGLRGVDSAGRRTSLRPPKPRHNQAVAGLPLHLDAAGEVGRSCSGPRRWPYPR